MPKFAIKTMIEKRYEYMGPKGKQWTQWMDFCKDDSKLEYLQTEEKYQLKPRLLNEYRIKT